MLLRCTKPRPPRFLGSWMFLVRFSNFRKRVSSFERALFTEGFRTLSRIVARTRGDHLGRLYLLRLRGCDVKSAPRMLRKGTTMGTKFRLFFLDRLEKPISLPFSFFTMEIINSTRMKFSTVKLLHQFFSLRRTVEIFNPGINWTSHAEAIQISRVFWESKVKHAFRGKGRRAKSVWGKLGSLLSGFTVARAHVSRGQWSG